MLFDGVEQFFFGGGNNLDYPGRTPEGNQAGIWKEFGCQNGVVLVSLLEDRGFGLMVP